MKQYPAKVMKMWNFVAPHGYEGVYAALGHQDTAGRRTNPDSPLGAVFSAGYWCKCIVVGGMDSGEK